MANKILKTRIQIRNDVLANWQSVNPILLKGELGIATDVGIIKVGDSIKNWNDIVPLYDPANLQPQNQIHKLTKDTLDAADDTLLAGLSDLKQGDIALIHTVVDGVVYEDSAYIYDGENWAAITGRVDADKVILRQDITMAGNYTSVGNWSKSNANATLKKETKGKSVQWVLNEILSKDEPASITAQPSVSVTLTGAGAKEVGTVFTPSWSVTLNKGSYKYGPSNTGVTATSYSVSDSDGHSASTQSGTFEAFTVADGENYKISATVAYSEGVAALTGMGNTSDVKIAAGSKTGNSSAVTGYRSYFVGAVTTPVVLNSANIRAFGPKGAFAKNFNITIPEGCKQVVIALPNGHTLSKVEDQNAFGTDIVGSFVLNTVQVEGLNGYTAAAYNVYVYAPDAALGANTYKVTCA